MCVCVHTCTSCLTLCNPMDRNPPGFSVYGLFPGKNTGVDCQFLLQGIFLTQGLNPHLLCLPLWQADSLSLTPPDFRNISGRVPQTNGEYKLPLLGEDTRLGSARFSSVGYHALLSPLLQKATLKRGSFIELFHLRILRGALDVHPHSQPAKLLNLFCVSDQRSPASRI